MTIRILNYWPELLGRLQGLVEVEASDLLLDISDPVPLRSFAGLSSDRVYRQWSTQNGIYFILRQQRVADIGMSAPDDPEEDGLSGRVSAHACARLVRAYFPDQFEVSFLPLARTFAPLIVIVEDALIDTLNTPDFRRRRRELPVCQYQLLPRNVRYKSERGRAITQHALKKLVNEHELGFVTVRKVGILRLPNKVPLPLTSIPPVLELPA